MNDRIRDSIRQKLGDAIDLPFPHFTPREAETAVLDGKARAVIGMRRAGKMTFLHRDDAHQAPPSGLILRDG